MFCVIVRPSRNHPKCVTTDHPRDRHPAVMFSDVIVGVKELEAGRDALCLARALASAKGNLTLAHVHVAAPKPAPDSGAVGAAARGRDDLGRLVALRGESHLDAEVVCDEARDVRQGLHDIARAREADLLVIGASRNDEIYRDLVGDAARELLENAPCAVAVAPVGYADRRSPWRTIGIAYDGSPESDRALGVARRLAAASTSRSPPSRRCPAPGASRTRSTTKWRRRLSDSTSWAASTATPSTVSRPANCDAMGARSTSWCSARTSTAQSVVCLVTAPRSGWPTNHLARCSWWGKADADPPLTATAAHPPHAVKAVTPDRHRVAQSG